MKAFLAAAALTFLLPNFVAAQLGSSLAYKTREFSKDGSTIPSLFMCMHAGQRTGHMPNAKPLVREMLANLGATERQIELWEDDAELLINFEVSGVNFLDHWHAHCARQFGILEVIYKD